MKIKLIVSLIVLFVSLQVHSQTIEPLKVEIEKIYQATVALDYDAILMRHILKFLRLFQKSK